MRNGPELLLGLDRRAGTPLAHQLQERLRDAIRSGRLAHGERLPASRALAGQLGVSRGVVVDTYAQLESEGYLRSAQGSGTVVASSGGDVRRAERPRAAPPRFDVDFEYGVPDLRSFPMRDWLWAMGVAGRTATAADLGDEAGAGATQLREVLAAYLRRVRGAVADPDDMFVCAGFRYGLNLVLRALLAEGVTTAAVEDPGPVDHEAIARRGGALANVRPGRGGDPGTPGTDRGGAGAGAPTRAGRVGAPRGRVRRRGRLRRGVPLRPAAGGRGPGAGAGPGDRDGLDQQDPVADAANGLAGLPATPARRGGRREAAPRPRRARARPAGPRGARRVGAVRPAPAPDAWRLQEPARGPGRGARPVCAGGRRDGAGRRLSCGAAATARCYRGGGGRRLCGEFRCCVRHEPLPQRPGDRAGRAGAGVRQRQGERHPRRDAPGGSGPARPQLLRHVCPVVAVTPFSRQLLRLVRLVERTGSGELVRRSVVRVDLVGGPRLRQSRPNGKHSRRTTWTPSTPHT